MGGSGATAWLRHQVPRDRIVRLADAKGQVLGRLAVQIAKVLMGKHKPTYLDNIFTGDPVVVINAAHFHLTGRKMDTKRLVTHTGTPGGLKKTPVRVVLSRRPTDPLYLAVKRMMPANKLRSVRLKNLHLYPGEEHPHAPQQPVLMPPAHVGGVVGRGGVPPVADMENWWLDQICSAPDSVLDSVVAEVRAEFSSPRRKGLAELLDIEGTGDAGNGGEPVGSEQRKAAVRTYAAAADESRGQSSYPVVLPA